MEIDVVFWSAFPSTTHHHHLWLWLACLLACWLGSTPILGRVSVPIDLRHLGEGQSLPINRCRKSCHGNQPPPSLSSSSNVWTWLLACLLVVLKGAKGSDMERPLSISVPFNPTRSPVWTLFWGAIKKEHLSKTKRNTHVKRNTHH